MMQRSIFQTAMAGVLALGANLFFAARLPAYFSCNDAGEAGAQFLKQGEGARAVAMGKAFCAVADDMTALYWNPAGLARLRGSEFLGAHTFALESMSYDVLGFGQSWPGVSLAAGFNLLSMPPMEKLNESGESEGSFAPYACALNMAAALPFRNWQAGINFKYVREDLGAASAAAYAVDVGAACQLAAPQLDLGLALQNLGTPLQWQEQAAPLPFTIRCGAGYRPWPELILALDLEAPLDHQPSLHAGGEYHIPLTPDFSACARAGLQTTTLLDLDALSGLSLGAGFRFAGLVLDYAWMPLGNLGAAHLISLSAGFSEPAPAASASARPVEPFRAESASAAPAPEAAGSFSGNSPAAAVPPPERRQAARPHDKTGGEPGRATPNESPGPAVAAGTPSPLTCSAGAEAQNYRAWVDVYYAKSLEYFKLGKYYTAYTYCEQALKWDPAHKLLNELRGRIEAEMQSPESKP